MKLCISNNINQDRYILGDSFVDFSKTIKWLDLVLQRFTKYEDIKMETDQVIVFDEVIKKDALFIVNKYMNLDKGMAIQLLSQKIKIPPQRKVFSEINFINGIHTSNVDVINNNGDIFFDFYEQNFLIEIAFRSFDKYINTYEKSSIFENFSRIYQTYYKDTANLTTDYDNSINGLIDNKIVTMPSEVRVKVEETPAYARATSSASMDTPGPFETKANEAYYYITPVV